MAIDIDKWSGGEGSDGWGEEYIDEFGGVCRKRTQTHFVRQRVSEDKLLFTRTSTSCARSNNILTHLVNAIDYSEEKRDERSKSEPFAFTENPLILCFFSLFPPLYIMESILSLICYRSAHTNCTQQRHTHIRAE